MTDLTVFLTNNDNSAPVNADGLVTAAARGEAFVMGRFETKTVGSQVLVLPKDLQYTPPPITGNYIDQLVGAKLLKLRIEPSGLCTDEEFLRRVTLDIDRAAADRGGVPAVPGRRRARTSGRKLIDRLLQRKEFAEIWAMKWSELLMVKSSPQVSYKSMFLYSNWLTDKIANNVPLDQMVRELLSASGGTFENPATNFYQIETDTLKTAENVAQVFMGFRTQCAQCHNHPFDRWTMDDYYSFAAFFARSAASRARTTARRSSSTAAAARSTHPVGGRVMPPKFLGGEHARREGQGPPRRAGRMAHLARQPVLRRQRGQPRLGPLLRAWGSSSRWTTSASATRPAIRNCSRRWARSWSSTSSTSNSWCATSATRRPTSAAPCGTPATKATNATSPTPTCGGSPPSRRWIASARSRRPRTSSAACRWAPGRADRRRHDEHLLPDHLRPRETRDGLRRRSHHRSVAVAGPAPAQRRHGPGQDQRRAAW